ncbi:MAG: hypothetical protein HKM90_10495 [Desulfobacteraceae bacterium]|nr:hypothetical protein [Desulfobacteraceae bacterium]
MPEPLTLSGAGTGFGLEMRFARLS